jgi:hypothetical protein
MQVCRVNIRDYPVGEVAASVPDDYEAAFGEPAADPRGWYQRDDLASPVIDDRASGPIELAWHWSDRYVDQAARREGAGPGAVGTNVTSTSAPVLDPLWNRLVTGRSVAWRLRSLRNRYRARGRRLVRGTVRAVRSARWRGLGSLLEHAQASIAARQRVGPIASELRVPIGVRMADAGSALNLDPFAMAARDAAENVQIDLTPAELAIASRPLLSYHLYGPDGARWLAAHLPHLNAPSGFEARGRAATLRLETITSISQSPRRRRELVRAARQSRAVDCSVTSLETTVAARLIIDLAGAGAPLVAAALPGPVAKLVGPDLATAIESCDIKGLADPLLRERHSIALRRLVHRHHSAYANLAVLAAGHGHPVSAWPSVSILMATNRPEMVAFAVEQMCAQDYPNVEILCGLHGFSLPAGTRDHILATTPHAQFVEVGADRDVGQVLALLGERATGELVTKWDDDDWYGTEHLRDLVAAMRYSGASVVGKAAEYVYLTSVDVTLRRQPTGAETYSTTVGGGTLMLTRSMLQRIGGWPAGPRGVDRLLLEAVEAIGGLIYRAHGFGYLLRRDSRTGNHTWQAEDDYFLSQAVAQRTGLDLRFAGVTV